MTTEITYAEVKFKNESNSSGPTSELPDHISKFPEAPPTKMTRPLNSNPINSNPGIIKLLVAALLIFILLAISFLIALIVVSQEHFRASSELEEISRKIKEESNRGSHRNCSCCPKHWKAFGSSCYFISVEEKTWPESEKNCSAMQAHLLVVTTKEEQNFIIQSLDTKSEYYIGLHDRTSNTYGRRHWNWVDQTPYNESATFWDSGEPNTDNERCVVLHFHTKTNKWGWNDVICDQRHKSICKMTKIYFSA
ncbi:C-type lectin domain family 4 member A-like [Talpa occidentalis]|uniref:C-type lectin domain family 4 member A-like n=1 Tax=Talpa occidentalis TaxID=50954 RepID=UPI0023F6BCBC|nr:C-type lectin domain family 4 member A-like [Talpa occidentalis]